MTGQKNPGRSLEGRVALVTGAGRGIGEAIVRGLAAEGAAVALVARTRSEIERLAGELPGKHFAIAADVTKEDEVARSIEGSVKALRPIDILVNNAGHSVRGAIGEMPIAEWRALVDVNLIGPYLYCHGL